MCLTVAHYHTVSVMPLCLLHCCFWRYRVSGTAQFQEDALASSSSGMIVVKDIHFASISQTNLFPFFGQLHVAYVPANGVILGLSKFARIAR
jgi:GTP cyclohydrolase I